MADSQLVEWTRQYLDAYRIQNNTRRFRGEVLVAKDGQVVVQSAREGNVGRRFLIGSITKPMTAVAIMQLAQAGKLRLSDSIRTHIPELPEAFAPVTIDQLLRHRAGVANYTEDDSFMERRHQPISRAEMVSYIGMKSLQFSPGEKHYYSNSGYFLLGVLIERVSGTTWSEYLRENVFSRAGMSQTSLDQQNSAMGWSKQGPELVAATLVEPSFSFSAGAVVSTAQDLLRFSRALVDGTLLPAAQLQTMWTLTADPADTYGYGFIVRKSGDGLRLIGHSGGIEGFVSDWQMTDDGQWIAITLANADSVSSPEINADLLTMALENRAIQAPSSAEILDFDPELARQLVGQYEIIPEEMEKLKGVIPEMTLDAIKTMTWSGDTQYILSPVGQGPIPLEQRKDGVFINEDAAVEVDILREDQNIKGFTLRQGGLRITYRKIA